VRKANKGSFIKGVSGNPSGRPKIPEEIAMARKLNRMEFERIINKCTRATTDELKAIISDPTIPVLDKCVATILYQAFVKADYMRLNFILDRIIGKVPEPPKPVDNTELTIIEISKDKDLVLGTRQVDEIEDQSNVG
jgi:hypothetical protein